VLKLTLRGLRAHKLRMVATLLAVLLGVGFMVGTQVLGATLKKSFDDIFVDVYANIDAVVRSDTVVEGPFGNDERLLIDEGMTADVLAVDGVTAAEGQVRGTLTIVGKDGKALYNAQAGPPMFGLNWFTDPDVNNWNLVGGVAPASRADVVIDQATADDGGFAVGDPITLDLSIGPTEFTVSGIATFGELDDYAGAPAVLLDTATAQELVGEPGKFSWISAVGDDVSQEQLVDSLSEQLPGGTQAITATAFADESADPFREFIDQFTSFITAFGWIALFVGGFIIYNTFTVILAQRTRELALLRAIGASRRQVLSSVVGEAAVTGILGGLLGAAFGIVLATGLRAGLGAIGFDLPSTPLVIEAAAFITPLLLAFVITVVSALIPAVRASRIPPVAAMSSAALDVSNRSVARFVIGVVLAVVSVIVFVAGMNAEGETALLRVGGSLLLTFITAVVLGPLFVRPLSAVLGAPGARLSRIAGQLARENARRNPARTSTTAAAIVIAVGLVATIAIVASSAKASVSELTENTVVSDFVVIDSSFQGFSPKLASDVAALPEVAVATGLRFGFGEIGGEGAVLLGVDPVAVGELFNLEVAEGSLAGLGVDGIAITSDTATESNLGLGDVVPATLVSAGAQMFTVAAIYDDNPALQGANYLISQEAFDSRFPASRQADGQVLIKLDDGADPEAVRPSIEAIVAEYPTATLQNLDELQADQAGQIDFFVNFLYGLLFLSVLISLIGVVNTLLLSVYERTRELGLLRAVGAIRSQVSSMVIQEAIIIALIGTIIGLVIGLGFGWALVSALASGAENFKLIYAVPTSTIIVVFIGAVVAGVGAGLYPAFRAGRLNVLDAVSSE